MPSRPPRDLFAEQDARAPRDLFTERERSNILFGIPENPLLAAPIVGAAGLNVGLSDIAGAPVDLMNAGLGLVGAGSDRPFLGSQMIRENLADVGIGLSKSDVEQLPEGQGPIFAGGRTVGQSIPFAAAPLAAARAGVTGAKFLQPIMQSARTAPGTFATAEASAAAGAGAGRFAAENVAPGNELVGMAAEIIGGVLSPVALLGRAFQSATGFLGRISASLSRGGRERAAGTSIRRAAEKADEDIGSLITRLTEPEDIQGARFTSGQKSGSPTLLALENNLTGKIPGLDASVKRRIADTTEAFNRAFDGAIEGGDATLVQQISQERELWFRSLIEARVQTATQRAAETAERIQPRGPRATQSVSARNTLEDALKDARKAERGLWSELPRDLPIEPRSLDDSFQGVRAELLEEELLPAPVEAFMRRVQRSFEPPKADADGIVPEPEIITSGDLLRFRSRVLDLQRNARGGATPDFGLARRLGLVADGALDDLAELPGTDAARGFSRQLNQLFTRGEVGNLLGFKARGGARVEPELTLKQGIGGGGQEAAVASRQIEDAAQLSGLNVEGGLTRRTTVSEQEDFIRTIFVKAVDPTTGQVNARQLARLARDNRELLERFPSLKEIVGDAGTAQQALETTARLQGQSIKAMQQRSAFAQVAKFEDPVAGVAKILNGNSPLRSYREIARIARKEGPNAVAGLRRATFDYLLNAAGGTPGAKLRGLLNARSGKKTLLETMTNTGTLNSAQKRNLNRIIDKAEKFEQALTAGRSIDEVIPDPNAIEDLIVRVIGARIGAQGAAGAATGASLIAASAGSKFIRNLVQKIPAARTIDVIAEAIEDPKFMAALLNKGKTAASQRRLTRQINAFLLQTAIPGTDQESQ